MESVLTEIERIDGKLEEVVESLDERTSHDWEVSETGCSIGAYGGIYSREYELEVDGKQGTFSIVVKEVVNNGAEIKFQYRLEKRDIDSELDRYFQNIDHQLDLDAELKPAAEYAIVYEKTVS